MSSLWRMRVAKVEGNEITLVLQAIHPDAGSIPSSKVFALRLLADMVPDRLNREEGDQAYWDMNSGAGCSSRVWRTDSCVATYGRALVCCQVDNLSGLPAFMSIGADGG